MKSIYMVAASLFTAALVLSSNANHASAGFVPYSVYVNPGYGSNPYETSYTTYNSDGSASLDVDENWTNDHGTMYSFDVTGQVDSDPPLHIIKDVVNGTSANWIGYKINLDPADPHTFELTNPPPSSNKFALQSGTPNALLFGAGNVAPGQSVTFDFVVNVNFSNNNFHFTLTQMPITQDFVPEPATGAVVLLAMLGVAMVRRRR